jgi:hypothetical protein
MYKKLSIVPFTGCVALRAEGWYQRGCKGGTKRFIITIYWIDMKSKSEGICIFCRTYGNQKVGACPTNK